MRDPYDPKSAIKMADLAEAFRDLPKANYLMDDLHARYSEAAVKAGRIPASKSSLDKLLAWMGCAATRGRGRWINAESLARGWPREDWTPRNG